MAGIKKFANSMERFLQSERGQRFFNIAYSLGAAVVIWGALYKILHLRGGNLLLCIGMGTEVIMFILSAFDRPRISGDVEADVVRRPSVPAEEKPAPAAAVSAPETPVYPRVAPLRQEEMDDLREEVAASSGHFADLNRTLGGLNAIYELQLKDLSGQLESIGRASDGLRNIRDMYERSAENSARYCEETAKMAEHMRRINSVYEKMITAMTINATTLPGSADVRGNDGTGRVDR